MAGLILAAVLLTTSAHAHMLMSGPLHAKLLEHSEDIGQLKRYAGLDVDDSANGIFGLHYYYTLNPNAQRLTLRLLNSSDHEAQQAALSILAHCGGSTAGGEILGAINARLGELSTSRNPRIRKLVVQVKRALKLKVKTTKKTGRP